tara:strand:+ start:456 stop:1454 length:999 start_codon:yes stop_codon:yes gene_type:complete
MSLNIIAEVAQGFEGNYNQSKLLINAAASAGADLVKFQLVFADELANTDYKYYNLFKSLEMNDTDWFKLKRYSEKMKINLCFDVFGSKSLELAELIKTNTIKIHATDLSNVNFLKLINKTKISKVILGIGGGYLSEIKKAVSILKNKELIILHGFQGYPTKIENNQVQRLLYIKKEISDFHSNFSLGFADHPEKNKFKDAVSILAIGVGATVVEKHLTLGRVMKLEDYESALNPDEFKNSVKILRGSYQALRGLKKVNDFGMSKEEIDYKKNIKRHVVSLRELEKGTIIKPKDLTLKRTGAKEFIEDIEKVYNKLVIKKIPFNTSINKDQIK